MKCIGDEFPQAKSLVAQHGKPSYKFTLMILFGLGCGAAGYLIAAGKSDISKLADIYPQRISVTVIEKNDSL